MSRTTRTLPRWVQKQITSTNDLVNGYRGLQYGYSCYDYIPTQDGMVGEKKCWRNRGHDVIENEKITYLYSTDNGQRNLRNCKHSLPIGKACGWNMCEATGQDAKKTVRKLWARANRRWSALVIKEEMELMEYDNEDDRLEQERCANEYYDEEYDYIDEEFEGELYTQMDWIISEQEINQLFADVA